MSIVARLAVVRPRVRDVGMLVVTLLVGTGLAAVGTACHGFPPPTTHDEFSYLLAGETFAAGRLVNPSHPMWEHLETFHVLQRPAYVSKFSPAQGLVLAFGQITTGRPIVGVWLSYGFMCAALFWMLRAWLGTGWGLAITAPFALWMADTYWADSYWGGTVAAAGGALLFGGIWRLLHGDERPRIALVTATGVLLLANSRPYEGLLVSAPAGLYLLWWLLRSPATLRPSRVMRVALPMAALLALGAGAMLGYNRLATGHATEFPYQAYERRYDPAPLFLWQAPRQVPASPYAAIRREQIDEMAVYRSQHTLSGYKQLTLDQLWRTVLFFVPAALLLPLVALPWAIKEREIRMAAILVVFVTGGMALCLWSMPHYFAPLVGLGLAVYGASLRRLDGVRVWGMRAGRLFAVGTLAAWTLVGVARLPRERQQVIDDPTFFHPPWAMARARIEHTLAGNGAQNLVIVHYDRYHSAHREWVYNHADIDASPVVWARDLGAKNDELLAYFKNRRVWSLDVVTDQGPFDLRPLASSLDPNGGPSTARR